MCLTYIYLFPNIEGTAFKIGTTSKIKDRVRAVNAVVPLNIERCLAFDVTNSRIAHRAENKFLRIFHDFQRPLKANVLGYTEWFDIKCFSAARELFAELGPALLIGPSIDLTDFFPANFHQLEYVASYQKIAHRSTFRQGVGGKIKEIRTHLNMSQRVLAERVRVPTDRIAKFEQGILFPSQDEVILIAFAFYTTPQKFIAEYVPRLASDE